MADVLTREMRSRLMSRIRGSDTKPELIIRSMIRRMKLGYRQNYSGLPGKPDIVLIALKRAIFVHGCFWHRHGDCLRASLPASNRPFWRKKFSRNVKRDRENVLALRRLGWRVLIAWECETRHPDRLNRRIARFLNR